MKTVYLFLTLFFLYASNIFSQDITFTCDTVHIVDTLGKDIVFDCKIKNISSAQQVVFLVRTKNILPVNWTSSLCFESCFSPSIDSVTTTPEFGGSPLAPQEESDVSVHVTSYSPNLGVAYIQVQAGTLRNPNSRISIDFTAETYLEDVRDKSPILINYSLVQNYPNPFNPSTLIRYSIPKNGFVKLFVYNALGQKVAELVNQYMMSGNYEINFNASKLSSGVYFYELSSGNFTAVKKLILLK